MWTLSLMLFLSSMSFLSPAPLQRSADCVSLHISFAQFSGNGRFGMVGTNDGMVYIWKCATGQLWRTIDVTGNDETTPKFFTGMQLTPDGKSLIVAQRHLWMWDVASKELIEDEVWHQIDAPGPLALSRNGRFLLFSQKEEHRERVQVYDVENSIPAGASQTRYPEIDALACSPDNTSLLLGTNTGLLALVDRVSGKELWRAQGHRDAILSVDFSSDGKYILSGSKDRTARLWKTRTGRTVKVWQGSGNEGVQAVAFTRKGHAALVASDTATLWDIVTGKPLWTLNKRFDAVAFSPDGKYLLTGGSDGTLRMCDAHTARLVRTFENVPM